MPLPRPLRTALCLPWLAGCGLTELAEFDVGQAPICEGAHRWPVEFADLEDELREAIGKLRDTGTMCGEEELEGVGDLALIPELHCAARLDATVRVETNDIDQRSDGVLSAFARVNLAGYEGIVRHQLIAADFFNAEALLQQWLTSDGHCNALLDDDLQHIGIGHSRTADDSRAVWVVLTGHERM